MHSRRENKTVPGLYLTGGPAVAAGFGSTATHPYKPFLPAEAQPPNDLNKELMDKWRPLLEKVGN